jgi:hypothetical protein
MVVATVVEASRGGIDDCGRWGRGDGGATWCGCTSKLPTHSTNNTATPLFGRVQTPLILGINWAQLADVATLAPEYFDLISNPEIIAVDQDPSPQATLVAQYPSTAQQQSQSATLNITMQTCDLSRPDQRFTPFTSNGKSAIALADSSLCLSLETSHGSGTAARVGAANCNGHSVPDVTLSPDDELTVTIVEDSLHNTYCLTDLAESSNAAAAVPVLTAPKCVPYPPINHHSKTDPVPLAVLGKGNTFAEQVFIWGSTTRQIVGAGSGRCLTVGMPNHDPNVRYQTNNGTLELEVWAGPLTDGVDGNTRRVVALFNKGSATENVTASPLIIGTGAVAMTVRDIVARKAMAPLALGEGLTVSVPSHGVRLFVLEAARTEL